MTRRLEDELHDLLARRTSVDSRDLDALRTYTTRLPRRHPHQRGLLAAAAGILLVLSMGGLLATRIQLGTSGAAPQPPDPAAFAGDPRLALCGVTPDGADAIFEMAHLRDYPLHLPAAYPLKDLQAAPDAPTLVIVLRGQSSTTRLTGTPVPGTQDLCLVVGSDPATWQQVAVVGVDTSGLLAALPEPTGTPIADDLRPWVDRCGGPGAGIFAVVVLEPGQTQVAGLRFDPLPPEVAAGDASAVIVYDTTHPFAPLGTPPAPDTTIEPRSPLADGHHDLCVLVGSDPATATRHLYEDVTVTASSADPGASPSPGPSLPAQMSAADCEAMSFAPDRCLAVVEAALAQASLGWADVAHVSIAKPQPDTTSLGSQPVAEVTFSLSDGGTRSEEVRCLMLGSGGSLVCTDHPQIPLYTPYAPNGGYHDVPCGDTPGGEPGSACATPMPSIDPAAAAAAVPLEIASHDYPIAATGHLEIDVGEATLPNGILSDARLSLADPFTRAFSVAQGVSLEVRSLDPSRPPFVNVYEHGWYPGTETVEVFLVLDVTSVTRGAMLEVRDLVVR